MDTRDADNQGAVDAATLLPVVAALLFAPPIILIFAAPIVIAGIPLIVLYVFGVWAAVVLSALLLARRLSKPDDDVGAEMPPETRGARH